MMTADGKLVVVDRAASVVKMAIGEFLSPEKVEAVLETCAGVRQVLVCPNNKASAVVAIVVPHADGSQLQDSPDVWLNRFRARCRQAGMQAFEYPQRVIIDTDPWTAENGLLLPNLKISRRAIRSRHEAEIANDSFTTPTPTDISSGASILDLVIETIAAAVGCETHEIDGQAPLIEQGADSLTLVRLIASMHDLGMRLVSRQLLDTVPARLTMAEMARASPVTLAARFGDKLETRAEDADPMLALESFASRIISRSISGSKAGAMAMSVPRDVELVTKAEDVAKHLEALVSSLQAKAVADASAKPATSRPTLLVTGATGYFGSFVVTSILRRNIPSESAPIIVCLVRGGSPEAARDRLRGALLLTKDVTATDIDTALAEGRLRVAVGDMGSLAFGLEQVAFSRLAQEVDVIVNSAAAVKFFDAAYGYRILSAANVDGTAEVLRLATLHGRAVRVVHISTMTVDMPTDPHCVWSAEEMMRYNNDAYALTKTVAEALVRRVGSTMAIKPVIVRLPLLTWSNSGGVANAADWLVRLVDTCRAMRTRPACMRVEAWTAPINCLPVNFCADLVLDHLQLLQASTSPRAAVETIKFETDALSLTVSEVLELEARGEDGSIVLDTVSDHAFLTAVAEYPELPFAPLATSFHPRHATVGQMKSSIGVRQSTGKPAATAPVVAGLGMPFSLADSAVARLRIAALQGITWKTGLKKNKAVHHA